MSDIARRVGALSLRPALGVVASLALVGIAIASLVLSRNPAARAKPRTPPATTAPASTAATLPVITAVSPRTDGPTGVSVGVSNPPPSSAAPEATIVVHAAGAVRAPGVYLLAPGARVDDVIAAAGGLTEQADPDAINLAARVADAQRVFVPRRGQQIPAVQTGGATAAQSSSDEITPGNVGPLDLNAATGEQLDALPGIGPATAAAILEHRRTHGAFQRVEDLLDVPGIGPAKLAAIRQRVTLSGP